MKKTLITVASALAVVISLTVLPGSKMVGIFNVDTVSAATGDADAPAPTTSQATSAAPAPTASQVTSAAPAPATSIKRFLAIDSFGDDVALVQTTLNNKGYNLVVDGIYGKNTEAAVKDYQSRNGLVADGVVGPKTTEKLIPPTPVAAPETPATPAATINTTKLYRGLGHTIAFRNGPGQDEKGVPVYTFTLVMANATFDADGRIVDTFIDSYEVSTPNYDGASMPHFSGWPNTPGYNVVDHQTDKVVGVSTNTLESATAEVTGWKTKRERGDAYGMNPKNEWYKQMDFYQKFFVGKTVADLNDWFAKNTTSAGRPIKASSTNKDDQAKLAKLTDKEKAALADVVSGATMSLKDPHGDFLGAVANAYANRVEVSVPTK